MNTRKATFGGGRAERLKGALEELEGVVSIRAGYMGGTVADPEERDVNTGATGHAHVVQIEYEPSRMDFSRLLESFWKCHDPTQINRQGADVGNQYRSVIFFHDPEQESAARQSRQDLQSRRPATPIVTQIARASEFYTARG